MLMPDKHSLIKPLLLAINRQIETKTPAIKLCEELEGKIISINIKNTSHHFDVIIKSKEFQFCLLYTSPSPRDMRRSRMPSSA